MRVLMIYSKDAYTTGIYFDNAMRRSKDIQLLTAGFNQQGIINTTEIQTGQEIVISELLARLPAKPELIFVMQGFAPMFVHGIEKVDIPTAFYGIDTHTKAKDYLFGEAKKYKHVFFAHSQGVEEFRALTRRNNVHWLPCCAEPEIHRDFGLKEIYDLGFIGGIDLKEAHKPRRDLLKALAKKYKIIVGNAYGLAMTMKYNQCKLIFNYSMNDDINMRIFEALACGKVVLQNRLSKESKLDTLLKDRIHYIAFDGEKDLMKQANDLLSNPEARTLIGKTGQAEVLHNHTYESRIKEMICQINKK